jgi:hypothetical protein
MQNRYSLRTALLLLAVLAIASAILATRIKTAHHRKEAVTAARALGGYARRTETSLPDWLIKLVGANLLQGVSEIRVPYTGLSDEHMHHIGKLPCLRTLTTNHIARGNQMATLRIADAAAPNVNTGITDDGLRFLSNSPIEELVLYNTSVTDAGLVDFLAASHLRSMHIDSPSITDESVAQLERQQTLEVFNAVGTSISPDGIGSLKKALPNCKVIHVRRKAAEQ